MACSRCRRDGHRAPQCPRNAFPEVADAAEALQKEQMAMRREGGAAAELLRLREAEADHQPEAMSHNHVHRYEYGDDDNGHSGSFCTCGAEEPIQFTAQVTIVAENVSPEVLAIIDPAERERTGRAGGLDPKPHIRTEPVARFDPRAEAAAAVADFLQRGTPAPVGSRAESDQLNAIDAFFNEPVPEDKPARKQTSQYGYLIIDPTTGDFRRFGNGNVKGITRTTTFNKAASDQTAIKDWSKRNVLVGASRRPDLVAKAHKLDVSVDKAELNALVEKLEEAADAKVSADIGTMVHDYTERIDAGEITLDDVPPMYRGHVTSYTEALADAGLRVVPKLIEGTVFIPEFGGVAGKFDRVLEHVASRTHVMGDLKTGKNMVYGWDEIETQEAIYTSGYNRFGTYHWGDLPDGSEDTWVSPEVEVRTDIGVVMWLPVQTPTKPYPAGFSDKNPPRAGRCYLLQTDLERGWRHAELCGAVRAERAAKGKPAPWSAPQRSWLAEFAEVPDVAAAGRLWEQARAAGVDALTLGVLVKAAQSSLRARGLTPCQPRP